MFRLRRPIRLATRAVPLFAVMALAMSLGTSTAGAQTMCIEAPESVALAVLSSMISSAPASLSTLEGEPPFSVEEAAASRDLPSIPAILWCVSANDVRCMPANAPEAGAFGVYDGGAALVASELPNFSMVSSRTPDVSHVHTFGGRYEGRPHSGIKNSLERPPRA